MAEKKRKYGSGHTCAVIGCFNNSGKLKKWREEMCDVHSGLLHSDCACLVPYSFYKFPNDEELKRQWIAAINRKDYFPSKYAKVCSVHFLDIKPSDSNPVPSLHLGYPKQIVEGSHQTLRVASPRNRRQTWKDNKNEAACSSDVQDDDFQITTEISDGPTFIFSATNAESQNGIPTTETVTQCNLYTMFTTIDAVESQANNELLPVVKNECVQANLSDIEYAMLSHTQVHFYTGLSKDVFGNLIKIMSDVMVPLNCKLQIPEQLLLVTMRLRLGLFMEDLAEQFRISPSIANKLFKLWIPVMRQRLESLICWLPKETIMECMPPQCKEQQPNTTCIIDCIEIVIQRSNGLRSCPQTYSSYMPHNTVKFLTAIAPHGYVMYVSPCYEGRATDKHITLDSGFLDMLQSGDEVMADRRFRIESELSMRGVTLNIPAFTSGEDPVTDEEVTTRIASSKIHIEQMQCMNHYHIISTILPISCLPLIDDIVVVIAALVNLRQSLTHDP